jgi:hypothetical protein
MYLLGSRYCDTQKLSDPRWPLLQHRAGRPAPAYATFAATDFGRDKLWSHTLALTIDLPLFSPQGAGPTQAKAAR